MAKAKRSSNSGGPHKKHGPKRHLFKEYRPMIHVMAKTGLLKKDSDYESFVIACSARGKRTCTQEEFTKFAQLTKAEQKEYLKNLSDTKSK